MYYLLTSLHVSGRQFVFLSEQEDPPIIAKIINDLKELTNMPIDPKTVKVRELSKVEYDKRTARMLEKRGLPNFSSNEAVPTKNKFN
jgi:hypothetical protein